MDLLNLQRSLKIINSLWLRAGAVYFIDHVTLLGSLGLSNLFGISYHAAWFRSIDKCILVSIKIALITWTLGRIIEILTHESPAAHFENFIKILRKGIWIVIAAMTAPWIIHFFLWLPARNNAIPIDLVTAFLSTAIAFWSARQFIKVKYGSSHPQVSKDIPLSLSTTISGILFLLLFLTAYILDLKAQAMPWASPLTAILTTQIYFLAFTYFAVKIITRHPEITHAFTSSRTLILVNPPSGNAALAIFSTALRNYPPFFCVLKALTPERYRVIEYNRFLWQSRYAQANALVAISCFTSNSAEAYKIAREFRKQGSKVVMGGPHVSFFPDEALEFCDSVVIGPAESVWDTIIADYESNTLKPVYHGAYSQEAQARTYQYLLKAPIEITASFLQASRGCKFNCYFCSIHAITGHHLPERTLEELLTLIKRVTPYKKAISFIDNNIYIDPAYAKELFRAMIPLKIKWTGDASIDIAKDDEAVQLLKESGCHTLLIGFEIISSSKETARGGKFAYVNDYIQLTRKLQKAGVRVKAQFIFGFPGDNWRTLAKIWWFCFKLRPSTTVLSFLTPLPGSRFLDDSIREERLINLNWRDYDIYQQVTSHPNLGRSYLLQKGFLLIMMFFFVTTSSFGRLCLLIILIMEFIFFHGA
ncbi:MAG: B12-binding domain-containing radical SAM protein [Candidatus Omnitrophica bacterium]|nr:B12-binding domain-containing radical SAM protein [Candidatus Omnitrophota bacterium]